MAKERIISGQVVDAQEDQLNVALRPQHLGQYIGQPRLVEKLAITLEAVKQRDEPMEHVLLHGPPGLGKTTLAHIIAKEMGSHIVITSGPALTRPTDLVGMLTKLQRSDVLFIDEIHRLSAVVEEYIYPAMEDFKIDVTIDSGMHAKTITLPLKPFTLIGATTRAGLMTGPMRSRFGVTHNLDFYSEEDLTTILHRSATLLKIPGHPPPPEAPPPEPPEVSLEGASGEVGVNNRSSHEPLVSIARRARGTPRIANRLLRRVRDYAQVRGDGAVSTAMVEEALSLEGVDELGLDDLDRKYLTVIAKIYDGGPVGLEAIAATLGEDSDTLEDMVEPYLLQIGFLARTRKGRQLTARAAGHLGIILPTDGQPDDKNNGHGKLFET